MCLCRRCRGRRLTNKVGRRRYDNNYTTKDLVLMQLARDLYKYYTY
jgi:hypothetical protein